MRVEYRYRRLQAAWLAIAVLSAIAGLGLVAPVRAAEESPLFQLPVACTPGKDCAAQNYVDHDPGPGAADFTCGFLTYDGHKGTDIRLPDLAAMDRGAAVLAAAPGTVLRLRDGMPDVSIRDPAAPPLEGRDAGNSLIIDHGGGWETQYGHMRKGSILVKPGDTVDAGQPIGAVGLSGNTEFPHLHFEVRHDGKIVDPFTGLEMDVACGEAGSPLWTAEAAEALAYRSTGLLAAGFAGEVPDADTILAGAYDGLTVLPADAPVLIFWASLYGVRRGDVQTMRIVGPDGALFVENTDELPGPKAAWRAWGGKKRKDAPWAAGTYRGEYRLMRGEETIVEATREIEVR
jgi:murein DD-endopeptidase MepM/ murein hydrolase activator NlpD